MSSSICTPNCKGRLHLRKLKYELIPLDFIFTNQRNQSRFLMFFKSSNASCPQEKDKASDEKTLSHTSISICDTESSASMTSPTKWKVSTPSVSLKGSKKENHNYTINIVNVITRIDQRTTLMIKNIPNKYTRATLVDIINANFAGKFDLLYLPLDSKLKKNYGYAFINLVDSMHVIYFYHLFHGKKWVNTNSEKICEITFAKIQGKAKLLKHYPSNHMQDDARRPLFFEQAEASEFILPEEYKSIFLTAFPLTDYNIKDNKIFVQSNFTKTCI